jgi:glyoxylase-like metal-dependent hydrolase (beta-lactamase superfamily II)/8-oxo-dGTP pyrophosphatase MutT (NUDIX family)
VRECFEEAGLLFAAVPPGARPRLQAWRERLQRGSVSLAELCVAEGLTLTPGELVYLSHWVTPVGLAKRFDTRFFVARAPAGQLARHDDGELVEQRWLTPAAALAAAAGLKLVTPTRKTLEWLGRFESVDAALDAARGAREVPTIMPRLGHGAAGLRPVTPEEPAYAELGRIDPQGRGHASYDIQPGVAVPLSPRTIRVTANNGSVMTGPGTNSYLVGGGPRNEWAVIDPGPLDAAHVDALLAAAPGPIRWIFATHTHKDHSPACTPLAQRCGAPVHGRLPAHRKWQDPSFAPDVRLVGGERFELDAGVKLSVLQMPGHASNHLCYRLEEEKTLFTGDHVMQQSTVVINPPDGDMAAYLVSLRALQDEDLDWLAPGHGFLMAQPRRAFQAIVAHRLRREAKVVDALRVLGPASLVALLARVYDDVPGHMHPVALRSLQAHLIKLRADGRVAGDIDRWELI